MARDEKLLEPAAEEQLQAEELVADDEEHAQLAVAKAESKKNHQALSKERSDAMNSRGEQTEGERFQKAHTRP